MKKSKGLDTFVGLYMVYFNNILSAVISLSFFPIRTELHLNHFADNNAFGITPQNKVNAAPQVEIGLWRYYFDLL